MPEFLIRIGQFAPRMAPRRRYNSPVRKCEGRRTRRRRRVQRLTFRLPLLSDLACFIDRPIDIPVLHRANAGRHRPHQILQRWAAQIGSGALLRARTDDAQSNDRPAAAEHRSLRTPRSCERWVRPLLPNRAPQVVGLRLTSKRVIALVVIESAIDVKFAMLASDDVVRTV